MSKILWISDAGSHGGFSTVTHQIGERLVTQYGHEIHCLATNFKGDPWDTPLKLYVPNFDDRPDVFGQSRIIDLMAKIMPDAIVFVQDPQVVLNILSFNPWDKERVVWRGIKHDSGYSYKPPILGYLAVDGYNNPRSWDILTERVTRIAMSAHGQRAMPEAPVIHHGVDTTVFYPRDKAESKRALGFDPDRFLILRVDKNTWRKDYPATWRALRPVLRQHPDIDVHFHCRPQASDGYDINNVMWNDEDVRERVSFTPNLAGYTGLSEEKLALMFSAADLFVSTSWGEGAGLNNLQAIASGTPVIAQDCSAITEYVGPGGILIKPKDRMYVPMGQEQCVPDVERFTYWIEHLYGARKQREALAKAGVEHAQQYTWDLAASQFNNLIEASVSKP